jgi:hypothetical protein
MMGNDETAVWVRLGVSSVYCPRKTTPIRAPRVNKISDEQRGVTLIDYYSFRMVRAQIIWRAICPETVKLANNIW